jgi:integrase/recombinase XerD
MATLKLRYVNSFPDRHGKLRHQCRIPGRKSFGLPGVPGSVEFMEAYQAALAGAPVSRTDLGASRTRTGTVNAAVVGYYKDKLFTDALAPESQRMRRAILERLRNEHGEKRIALLTKAHIVKLLEPMTPHAQKNWLKTTRGLMAYAVSKEMIAADPTEGVIPTKAPKSNGHMTWREPQIERFRGYYPLGTMARLALELMLNIAARRYDAHVLGHQHIRDEGKGPKLCWRPHKTLRTTNKLLKVRVLPELQAALDAVPPSDDILTFLKTDHGKPFASAAAFGNKFADWCRAAGLKPVLCDDGKVRSFRAHGLRKAALRALAHAGCTDEEMMQVSGHSDARQLREYLNEVDQEEMADAAFEKLLKKRAADQNGNSDLQTSGLEVTNRKVSA